jgi:hypothetical protein
MFNVKKELWLTGLGLGLITVLASGCNIQSEGTGNGDVKQLHGEMKLDVSQFKKDLEKLDQPIGEIKLQKLPSEAKSAK